MSDFWTTIGGIASQLWTFLGDMEVFGHGISMLDIIYTLFAITLAGVIVNGLTGSKEE